MEPARHRRLAGLVANLDFWFLFSGDFSLYIFALTDVFGNLFSFLGFLSESKYRGNVGACTSWETAVLESVLVVYL